MNTSTPARRIPRIAHERQRGFSLVELMVSVVIGLVILAALVALFVNTSGSNREMARANSLIENGRLAVQLLESDIAHAGYWGGHMPRYDDFAFAEAPTDAPSAIPDPCLAYTVDDWDDEYVRNMIGIPVQVYETPPVACAGVIDSQEANTDILVVRHVEVCVPGEDTGFGTCESDVPAGRLYFQTSRCQGDAARYVFGTDAFVLRQRDCATEAEKRKFISNIYYVRDHAVTPGDGIPTLMRSSFDLDPDDGVLKHLPAVPLIEGIERFHVELGIDNVSKGGDPLDPLTIADYSNAIEWADDETRDTALNRGDGAPDGDYVSCTPLPCDLDQLVNVTAVKLYLLVRSREPTPTRTDEKTYDLGNAGEVTPGGEFARHLFVSTLRLPNIAGRRETP